MFWDDVVYRSMLYVFYCPICLPLIGMDDCGDNRIALDELFYSPSCTLSP